MRIYLLFFEEEIPLASCMRLSVVSLPVQRRCEFSGHRYERHATVGRHMLLLPTVKNTNMAVWELVRSKQD